MVGKLLKYKVECIYVYANDVAFVTRSDKKLENTYSKIEEAARSYGL